MIVKHGISGFGPRAANHIIALIALLCIHEDEIAALQRNGLNFLIELTIFEKQSIEQGVGGNAYQLECEAALNTPIPNELQIPGLETIADTHPVVYRATNIAKAVGELVESDPERLLDYYKKVNLAAYSTLKNALGDNGKLDTSQPSVMRRHFGQALTDNVYSVIEYANKNLPCIKINLHHDTEVTDLDLTNSKHPTLLVEGQAGESRHQFDFIQFENGLPWRSRVRDSLAAKTYSRIATSKTLWEFLDAQGLLSEDGRVKPGTRLAIRGAGLSAYDYVTLIATLANVVVPDDSDLGYRVDQEAAKSCRGLITFVNRRGGMVPPPRLLSKNGPNWPNEAPKPILNGEELHALFLQKDFQYLPLLLALTKANIARALNTVPGNIYKQKTTLDRFADYEEEVNKHFSGQDLTESGLLLLASANILLGIGLDHDAKAAEEALRAKAPITYREYSEKRRFRALVSDITSPEYVQVSSNAESMEALKLFEWFYSASPPQVQQMMNLLSKCGVLHQICGSEEEFGLSSDGNEVTFRDLRFDALLSPKVMERGSSDPLLQSLTGKVGQHLAGVPVHQKGRFLVDNHGKPLPVRENGAGGEGDQFTNDSGTTSTVGVSWHDTRGYSHLCELVPQLSCLTLCLSLLKASGVKEPVSQIQSLHKETLPTPKAFNDEVAKFEGSFYEILEKIAFLELCAVLAADDAQRYLEYSEHTFHPQDRARFIAELSTDELSLPEKKALRAYLRKIANPLPYNPVSLQGFEKRFVDLAPSQLEHMFKNLMAQVSAKKSVCIHR